MLGRIFKKLPVTLPTSASVSLIYKGRERWKINMNKDKYIQNKLNFWKALILPLLMIFPYNPIIIAHTDSKWNLLVF